MTARIPAIMYRAVPKKKSQYPPDYNPPLKGTCVVCGCETKGATKAWLERCPEHWQALMGRR